MIPRQNSILLLKAALLPLASGSLTSCQPISGEDPLDQDAFATESVPVVPVNY